MAGIEQNQLIEDGSLSEELIEEVGVFDIFGTDDDEEEDDDSKMSGVESLDGTNDLDVQHISHADLSDKKIQVDVVKKIIEAGYSQKKFLTAVVGKFIIII